MLDMARADAHDTMIPRDSGVTDRSSEQSVDSAAMTGRVHVWQELKEDEVGFDAEKKTLKGASSSDNEIDNNDVAVVKRGSTDEVLIEMDPITDAPPAFVAPGDTPAGCGCSGMTATPAGVEYKVYKRRWFGLVQLTLLNIIVSWDVSALSAPRRVRPAPRRSNKIYMPKTPC